MGIEDSDQTRQIPGLIGVYPRCKVQIVVFHIFVNIVVSD